MRYNSPQTPSDQFRAFFFRGGAPVTATFLALNAVTFFIAFASMPALALMAEYLAYSPTEVFHRPWTVLTYPLVYLAVSDNGFFNFLIGGFLFWSAGGSLERSWGSLTYLKFFVSLALISALCLLLGSFALHQDILLFGFFLPMAGVVVAFCTLRPEENILFFFFPIPAKYFAVIVSLFTWVYIGQGGRVLLGLFGLGGVLAAYLYVKYGRSWADVGTYSGPRRGPRGPDLRIYPTARPASKSILDGSRRRSLFDVAGRWKDWQERRRLEKLLRNSGFSDTEPRWRDDEERRRP